MKKISFIGLLILTILINSCGNDFKSEYCKNQLKLIEPNTELKLFEFKFDSKPDSILNLIENTLKIDICDKVTSFGIRLEDLRIKTFVFGECNVTFLHKLSSNEIDLNKNGDVLIQMPNTYDGFIVTKIDSIPNWFEKYYPIKHDLHSNVIRLSWGNDVNGKFIKKAIENITDGYLTSLNKKSIMSFNKELCELSGEETDKLKTENPFELELRRVSSSKRIVEIESEE